MNVPGLIKNANAQKFWLKPESGEFTTIEELDGSILAGSPDDIVRGVQRYQEIGCDLLIFDFRMRFPDWLEQIEILAREVLPRVSEPDRGRRLGSPPGEGRGFPPARGPRAHPRRTPPMKTTTSTQVTHYEIQKKRRESLLEEWRGYHKKVIKRSDVDARRVAGAARRDAASTPAGTATGRPRTSTRRCTRSIPASTTTIHRHSWDAIMFIESGSRLDRDRRPADRLEAVGHAPPARAGRGTATATRATSRRSSTPGASSRCSSSSASRSSRRAATRPSRELPAAPAAGRAADRRRPVRPADAAARAPVGGQRERPADHPLRRRPRARHQARRPQPVPGRQVDRLPHGRAIGGHARARPGHVPVAPSPRRRGVAVGVSRATGYSDRSTRCATTWEAGDLIVVDHWQWHQHFNDSRRSGPRASSGSTTSTRCTT